MILLDTNVISEAYAAKPNERVLAWFASNHAETLFLSSITEAELWRGVAAMPDGKTKQNKTNIVTRLVEIRFAGRLLPFDSRAAKIFGEMFQTRKKLNGKDDPIDVQIAAIAKAQNFKLATRNVKDFEGCGVEVTNPWD